MSTTTNGAAALGHVDQIREIIVGDDIRSLDARLASLEQRMLDEVGTVRKELAKAHNAKERELNKEIRSLGKKLEKERAARLKAEAASRESASTLESQVQERISVLSMEAQTQAESLNGSMINRDALASALADIAEKLRDGAI